jgi:hypothetical protein
MFQITGVSVPNGNGVRIFGGPPDDRKARSIGESFAGGVYWVTVQNMGTLSLEDIGWTPQQAWGVRLNSSPDSVWLYQGGGQASIAVDADGEVSINGTDMHTTLIARGNGQPGHSNEEYLAAAQRFAPVVTFYHDGDAGSEEQSWPCSIDFLLEHSTLRRGQHDYSGYNTNGGTPPGIAWFKDRCHIFFQDHGGNGVMHIVSPDGLGGWDRPASWYHGSNTSAGPSAVEFRGKLHLFFRDPTGNGMYHESSSTGDDWNWVGSVGLDCDGQPEVIATRECLYLVAVDAGGNGIMYAKSTDGEHFSHGYTGYNTNSWTSPSVAWFNNEFHIFFQDHGGNGLMHITSPTGEGGWNRPASWYHGVNTSAGPAAVAANGKLHLFFRDPGGNGIFHQESTSGDDWGPAVYLGLDCDGQPQVTVHHDDVSLACVDAGGNGIMVGIIDPLAIKHPAQNDLAAHADSLCYLEIEQSAYRGQMSDGQVTAPMYFTVQQRDDGQVDITYLMLYAWQGGQPCRADRRGTEFNCIVENYGMHQGDLEWVTVRLNPALTAIEQVGYACHGTIDGEHGGGWWPTEPDPTRGGATYLREGERPIVRVTRNGHSCRNGWNTGSDIGWAETGGISGLVLILDLFSNLDPTPACPAWRPFKEDHPGGLIPLGLTADGKSVNEPWALYGGRLGDHRVNLFESATYVNGRHLDDWDWAYVKGIGWGAELLGKISDEAIYGYGPWAPGTRDFVKNSALLSMQKTPPQQEVLQQAAASESATAQPTSA